MTVWEVKKKKKRKVLGLVKAQIMTSCQCCGVTWNTSQVEQWRSKGFMRKPNFSKPVHVISVCWYCIYVLCYFSVFRKYTCTCLLQLWVLCFLPSGTENSPSDPLHSHLYASARFRSFISVVPLFTTSVVWHSCLC